jgi:hypothetical protein
MGRIAVSTLQPGMTLGEPVFTSRHQCLAEAGTVLDARKISLFQSWGIVEVEVQRVTEPSLQELEERMAATLALQRLSTEIDERFYGAERHPLLEELRRLVKKLALAEHEAQKR